MGVKKIVLALPLFLLIVGCSASNPGGSLSPKPTTLYVTRINLISANGFAPFQTTIHDAAMVEHLYAAALALPAVPPRGVKSMCLNDLGLRYRLVFRPTPLPSNQMELNPGGCQLLYIRTGNYRGTGKIDVRQMDTAFLSLFARTIKVPWLGEPSL